MGKRANNEGSVYQRSDGRWVAAVTLLQDGRMNRVTKYAATQNAAVKVLRDLKKDQDAGRPIKFTRETLRQWLDAWLSDFIEPQRSARTYAGYAWILSRIPEEIGATELSKVTPHQIQKAINDLTAAGKGSTADQLRRVLRAALNRAVKLRKIADNPVTATDPPKYEKSEGQTLTGPQAAALLNAAAKADDPLRNLWALALYLGLRKSEIRGLKREDVDLEKRRIFVQRSLHWIKGKDRKSGTWIEQPCKTVKSRRTLPLFGPVLTAIAAQVTVRESQGWKGEYLFVSPIHQPLHSATVTHAWAEACKRAKVSIVRFHDARHSCGSLLHSAGASPFVIQEILGHTHLATTRRYTHTPQNVLQDALEKMAATVKKPKQPRKPKNRVAVTVAVN
ncbi:MAG: hypothetical protein C0504_19525 [Candidatus Solibacter sp.]|nr:hypothetical protein [Candidatus Solibacter sp.]